MKKERLELIKRSYRYVFLYEPGQEGMVIDSFMAIAERDKNFDIMDTSVLTFQMLRKRRRLCTSSLTIQSARR